jgi:hypothetical protein
MSLIKSNVFGDALIAAGIITPEQNVRRVVIDATLGDITVMYLECYGDTRLLEVVPALTGVEIRREEVADGSEAAA